MFANLTTGNSGQLRLKDNVGTQVSFQAATGSTASAYTLPATAGTAGQFLQTNGSGTLAWANLTTYAVNVYLGANQTLGSNTTVPVQLNTANINIPAGSFNTSTYTYTAPTTGLYLATVNFSLDPSGSNGTRAVFFNINGSATNGYSVTWATQNQQVVTLTGLIQLTSGQTLSVQFTGRTGDIIQANATSLNIRLISA